MNIVVGCDFLILEAYACSDVGVQRPGNEDNLYFNGLVKGESDDSFSHYEKMNVKKSRAVFGVFDGMGGYANGEHAAFITAETARKILKENKKGDPQELLRKISIDSNMAVCEEVKNNLGQRMGSTLAMLYFEGTHFSLCNIGDSPVYVMRKGELKQLSKEHTEAATYKKIYGEDPPKGKKFPLTQHIGMSENLDRLKPYFIRENVNDGDIFLICSDGLTDMLDDAEILRIVNSSRPVSGIGKILLHNSLDRGGKDNITFILIKVSGVGEPIIELPQREQISTESKPENSNSVTQSKIDLSSLPELSIKKEPVLKPDSNRNVKKNPEPKTEVKSDKSKISTEKDDSDEKEERAKERKSITKIIVGTVILLIIIAAAAFVLKDYYPSSSSDNNVVDSTQQGDSGLGSFTILPNDSNSD